MEFYNTFIRLCNLAGKSPSRVALEIGTSKPAVTRWKGGSMPSDATLQKISDYFGVSVEYLKGETDNKKEKGTVNTNISDDDIKFALFDGDIDEITDEMYAEVKSFAQFVKNKHKKKG